MFAGAFHGAPIPTANGQAKEAPEPIPVVFPLCAPQAKENLSQSASASPAYTPLVALLQTIQRPTDIQTTHFEALGLHVISDAPARDILPDASYLPSIEQWTSIPPEDLEAAIVASQKPLNNGNLSPSLQTYLERRNELSTDNRAAFRTIRRIPPPTGGTAVRLGNAYEFFKNLELFSGYWDDTSLPPKSESETSPPESEEPKDETPPHLRIQQRTATGSQLPPEYRQQLLTAFVKLVAYDFGCNVSFPRVEPRLHLTPSQPCTFPSSYFNSSAQFIYRTPRDRASARIGVVEGPLATISCRTTTVFATAADSKLDFAREIVAVLLTAQQRAREGKEEKRFGSGKWWTTSPRWGGGPGGAIGKEVDKTPLTDPSPSSPSPQTPNPAIAAATTAMSTTSPPAPAPKASDRLTEVQRVISGISSSPPPKKSRRGVKDGNLAIYENYRRMLPPSSNWDPKARYEALGKVRGSGYDDIFLISALNHHVSIVRVHVPEGLLDVLGGEIRDREREWGRVVVTRSRWFDLFLKDDRIEAMGLVWGMMSWLMRAVDEPVDEKSEAVSEPMDTS